MKVFAILWILVFDLYLTEGEKRFDGIGLTTSRKNINLTSAIKDIVLGLPATHVTILLDNILEPMFPELLTKKLHDAGLTTSIYLIDNEKSQQKFCEYTKESMTKYEELINVIFTSRDTAVDLFWMVQQRDLIHRKLLYIFYWGQQPIESGFSTDHFEAMRIAVISSPRSGTYRVYYSQADASGNNGLTLVNWWSSEGGLFRHPVLPPPAKVYQNFKGRVFDVPILHKPPWHFVEYLNNSFKPDGGRDDKLLAVIAGKLNFRYRYVDPPERIQGSKMNENGTFPGVLGLVWQREVDFFMGDVTITHERSKAVEFSFLTLVDSEAFVTHRPSKLNEAFALLRPFQWQVWPPIIATFALYGPILFGIIEAPNIWRKRKRTSGERRKLIWDCVWFSTTTFLRQGGVLPGSSHKVRLVLIIVTLGATYVIGDMYSANLTSMLARPGREKPITVLEQLEAAMNTRGYELLVEKHGSSLGTLQVTFQALSVVPLMETLDRAPFLGVGAPSCKDYLAPKLTDNELNGTGIYERLWKKMQRQNQYVIESVELGMKLVRKKKNVAVLGGRETLYFDTKRFGSYNFHLSEKLNTRYSAIAMQLGCPYIEKFNRILMQLFEGGILTKMTEEEYERLGEKQRAAAGVGETDEQIAEAKQEVKDRGEASETQSDSENPEEDEEIGHLGIESRHQLRPLNTRMLQGAFYILIIGYLFSGVVLLLEMKTAALEEFFRCKRLRGTRCQRALGEKMQFLLFWANALKNPLDELLRGEEEVNEKMTIKTRTTRVGAIHKNETKFIL